MHRSTWILNAAANTLFGISKLLFDAAVLAILTRSLPSNQVNDWAAILQLVSYIGLLGLGIQTAISKFAAEQSSTEDQKHLILRAALKIVSICALTGVFASTIASLVFYATRHAEFTGSGQNAFALLLLGAGASLQLYALIPMGAFMAIHKNTHFALPTIFSRIITIALIWFAAKYLQSQISIAAAYTVGTFLVVPALFLILRRTSEWNQWWTSKKPHTIESKKLLTYCKHNLTPVVSSFAITIIPISIVTAFDFKNVIAATVAMTFSAALGGLMNALMSPLIPFISRTSADLRNSKSNAHRLLLLSRWTSVLMSALIIGFVIFGDALLKAWIGSTTTTQAYQTTFLIFLANAIRFSLYPYFTFLQATHQHGKAMPASIGEAMSNLLVCSILVPTLGVNGIGWAAVIGGIVGMLIHFKYTFARTPGLTPDRTSFILKGIALPYLFMLSPLLVYIYST